MFIWLLVKLMALSLLLALFLFLVLFCCLCKCILTSMHLLTRNTISDWFWCFIWISQSQSYFGTCFSLPHLVSFIYLCYVQCKPINRILFVAMVRFFTYWHSGLWKCIVFRQIFMRTHWHFWYLVHFNLNNSHARYICTTWNQ